ncbi:MAG: LuxR C-terminal-related transcriptional regulator [Prevotella sp.]|nr:LuxR C-terminal-related transcriptional regulator [Prevotella sp.]
MSDRLSISVHTVSGHRRNIFRKMGVQNLTEAINTARKSGLLA